MKMRNMVMHTNRIPMVAVWEIPKAVVGYSPTITVREKPCFQFS